MSGQTIRDVIIKIRMEQAGPTKLVAPDTRDYTEAIRLASQTAQQALNSVRPGSLNGQSSGTAGDAMQQSALPSAAAMQSLPTARPRSSNGTSTATTGEARPSDAMSAAAAMQQSVTPTKLSPPDTTAYLDAIQTAAETAQGYLDSVSPKPLSVNATAGAALQRAAAPSTTAMDAAGVTAAAAMQRASKTSTEMFSKEEREAMRVFGKIMSERERAAKQAEREYDKEANAAVKAYSRIMREREKAQQPFNDAMASSLSDGFGLRGGNSGSGGNRQRQQDAKNDLANQITQDSATKQRLEAYSQIGEGALRASRGVAFLTAATEEDLRVALAYISAAQGSYDVFAGLASIQKGLVSIRQASTIATKAELVTEAGRIPITIAATAADAASVPAKIAKVGATRAETAALGAAAVAQSALGTSTVATTAATWGQTAAVTALNIALAANPLTWALIAAGVAAAGVAYVVTKRQTEETEHAIAQSSKTLNAAGSDWERLAEQTRRGGEALAAAGADFDNAMKIISLRSQQPLNNTDDQIAEIRKQAELAKAGIEAENSKGNMGVGVGDRAKVDLEINRIEQQALNEELRIRQQVTGELQKQRDIASQALDVSKRTYESERRRFETKEEAFGRLSPGERNRLGGIGEKVEKKEQLTEQDARFLEQSGFGKDIAANFFRKRGQDAGADKILAQLGEAKELEQAARNVAASMSTFGEAVKNFDEATDENLRKAAGLIDKLAEKLSMIPVLEALIKGVEAEQQRMKQQIVNRDVGHQ